MNKVLRFARSMRFGLILLLPVLVCSVLGSVIPQGESESYYAAQFPQAYHLILGLGLDRMFATPVFLILTGLFGVNLALCTVNQYRNVPARTAAVARRAAESGETEALPGEKAEKLRAWLRHHRWRRTGEEGETYVSPALSWYGSVVTHAALLGIMLAAAGIFVLTGTADCSLFPGDNALPDGSHIRLEEFRVKDDTGRIDYVSRLEVIDAAGRSSGLREIRVNKPLRFGANKYYQQSYGVAGCLQVTVKATGETWPARMTEQGMISIGGVSAIWYDSVYPGYVQDGEGNFSLITQTTGEYPDPVYYVVRMADGQTTPMLAFPGDSIETDDAVYTFEQPIVYPSVRVKTTPVWVYALLYASFALITAGIWLCFFSPAAAVSIGEQGYSIAGKKSDTELRQRLRVLLTEGK